MSELERYSIHAHIQKYGIKTEQGYPLNFDKHMFLFEPYSDLAPKQVIFKAAQIGFSTLAINKTFWVAKNREMSIIYTLPTEGDVRDFAGGKVNRIIAQNPIYKQWTQDKDSVEQKRIGNSMIYFRGCFDAKTEVLTKKGWKSYKEIRIGDKLPSLNLGTQKIENDAVLDLSVFKVDEQLKRIKGQSYDALVTKDHRCVVKTRSNKLKIKRAFELNRHSSIPVKWKVSTQQEDSFWELIGFVIGDGSFWTKRDKNSFVKKDGTISDKTYTTEKVCIIQKKNLKYLRDLLNKNGAFFEKKHGDNGALRFELCAGLSERIRKEIPKKLLTFDVVNKAKSKASLYKGLMMSDGNGLKDSLFFQTNKTTIDAFQYLCVLIGRASNLMTRDKSKVDSFSDKLQYIVGIRRTKTATKLNISDREYKGIVWCPTTKNGTVFTRRNGKVSVTGQTWTKRAAIMISSDLNVYDEVDASKQQVVEEYATRLQHSKYKWEWYFSHPSATGTGVDRYWGRSNQRHWFIQCGRCKEYQYMQWPQNINQKTQEFICSKCKKPLSYEDRRKGEWIEKYSGREYSGYWISLLMAPWVTAKEIIDYFKYKDEEYFTNKVLGLPYVGGGNKLVRSLFEQNLTDENLYPNTDERVVIGVDTGKELHYVLGGQKGIFYYGTAKDYDEIESFLERWSRAIAVIDQGGDLIGSRKLREKYPGRVFLCTYGTDRKTKQLVRWGKHDEQGAVIADRNRMIQLVVDEFSDNRIPVMGNADDWYDYWCFIADTKISTIRGDKNIQDIKVGELVLTTKGYKKVYKAGISHPNAEVVEVMMSDGKKIVATPNHKVFTERGLISVDSLLHGDIIKDISNNKYLCQSSTKERSTTSMETIIKGEEHRYIERFGKTLMGKYKRVIVFITKMAIQTTMLFRTWKRCLKETTSGFISKNGGKTSNTELEHSKYLTQPESSPLQQDGIHRKKRKKLQARMVKRTAKFSIAKKISKNLYVRFVEKSIKRLTLVLIRIVLQSVDCIIKIILQIKKRDYALFVRKNLKRISTGVQKPAQKSVVVSNRRLQEKRIVYNLSVEGQHEYYANGLLVSNCHWNNLTRVKELDEKTGAIKRKIWVRANDDHWAHATTYWRVGMSRFGSEGALIKPGEISDPNKPSIITKKRDWRKK